MRHSHFCQGVLLGLAFLGWTGCHTASGPEAAPAADSAPAGAAPLRVGVTPRYPPLIFKQDRELAGFEVEMARALGQSMGRPVKFVEVDWDQQIDALIAGKTDIIMSSMTITFARTARVAFSNPYLSGGQMALVRRADVGQYVLGIPAQPEGALGVLEGTTGEFFVRETFTKSTVRRYNSTRDAAAALSDGRISMFISDAPVVWWMASVNEDRNLTYLSVLLTNEDLGWAVRKSDGPLLRQVNEFLASVKADGKLSDAVRRWLPH